MPRVINGHGIISQIFKNENRLTIIEWGSKPLVCENLILNGVQFISTLQYGVIISLMLVVSECQAQGQLWTHALRGKFRK